MTRSPRWLHGAATAAALGALLACGGSGTSGSPGGGGGNPPEPPAIVTTTLGDGTVGVSFSAVVQATGGTAPRTFSATGLPAGLAIAPATGTVTGTPAAAFDGTVHVAVADSASPAQTVAADLPLRIYSAPSITTTTLAAGQVGASYAATLAAAGGKPPLAFRVTAGALPDGLALSSSGAVAGTPTTAGTSSFTVAATDANGAEATRQLSIDVAAAAAAVAVATASLPDGYAGEAYAATLAATGGVAPYAWAVTAGALPAGLALSAAGQLSGTPAAAGTASFTVTATDANGKTASRSLSVALYGALSVTTASFADAYVGQGYVGTATATGGKAPVTWSPPTGGLGWLALGASTGLLTGTPASTGAITFTLQATDANGRSATGGPYTVTTYALPTIAAATAPDAYASAAYAFTPTTSGGKPPLALSVAAGALPAGLSVSGSSIAGTPTAAAPAASVTLQVTDANGRTAAAAFSIAVLPAFQVTSASPLPSAYQSVAYAASLAATGGKAPYAGWSVVSGALPAGVALAADGTLSGTPTAAGTFAFTVGVRDANGTQATKALELTSVPPPSIQTSALPDAYLTVAYDQTLAASGGKLPYAWSAAGVWPGLALDASTGRVSGTPTSAGGSGFTFTVTDANGSSATRALWLDVYAKPSITTASLPEGYTGTSYSQALATAGGKAPFTWSVSAGALPAGLAVDPATGAISGTPTASGSFAPTITVTDANGQSGSRAYALTLYDPPTITTASLPDGYVGKAYGVTLQGSGGKGPLSWSETGALPAGITFSSSGVIAGTPTAAGSSSLAVTVTDTNGRSSTTTLALTAYIPPGFSIAASPALEMVEFSTTYWVEVIGGKLPLTWQATGLPPGVSLSSDGVWSGWPPMGSAGTTYDGPLTVTDANGMQATTRIWGTVGVPTPIAGGGMRSSYYGAVQQNLTVFVLDDATGARISGAGVRVRRNGDETSAVEGLTDGSGRCVVTYASAAASTDRFDVTVAKPGYASTTVAGLDTKVVTVSLVPRPIPDARYGAMATYLTGVGPVLFGGRSASIDSVRRFAAPAGAYSDLLAWDTAATRWNERAPNRTGPVPTYSGGIASLGTKLLVYGGYWCSGASCAPTADAWTWDPAAGWASVSGGPPARARVTLAGEANGKALLFGGLDGTGALVTNDVYEYDGASWQNLIVQSTAKPSARAAAAGAYDAARGKLVVFGGVTSGGVSGETWEFDRAARTWTQRTPATTPAARSDAAAAYDTDLGVTWVFGGRNTIAATEYGALMKWDGTNWTAISATGPSPRSGASLSYDPAAKKLVLFGGQNASGKTFDSTWTYAPATNAWAQVAGTPEAMVLSVCPLNGSTAVQANVTNAKPGTAVTVYFAEKRGPVTTVQCTADAGGACSATQTWCGSRTVSVAGVDLDTTATYPNDLVGAWGASSEVVSAGTATQVALTLVPPGARPNLTGTYAVPASWTSHQLESAAPYFDAESVASLDPQYLPYFVRSGQAALDATAKTFSGTFPSVGWFSDLVLAVKSSASGACASSEAVLQDAPDGAGTATFAAAASGMSGTSECCTSVYCAVPPTVSSLGYTAPASLYALASIGAAGYPADRYVYFVPGATGTVPLPDLPGNVSERPAPSGQALEWSLQTTQAQGSAVYDDTLFRFLRYTGRQTTGAYGYTRP